VSSHSYAAVLGAAPADLKMRSMDQLYMVQMTGWSTLENGGEETRSPVNCLEFLV
jgi:hypothetical protein